MPRRPVARPSVRPTRPQRPAATRHTHSSRRRDPRGSTASRLAVRSSPGRDRGSAPRSCCPRRRCRAHRPRTHRPGSRCSCGLCSITSSGVPSGAERITETPPFEVEPEDRLQRPGREADQRREHQHQHEDDRAHRPRVRLTPAPLRSRPGGTARRACSAATRQSCMRPRKISKYSMTWLMPRVDRQLEADGAGIGVYPKERLLDGVVDPVVDVEIDLSRSCARGCDARRTCRPGSRPPRSARPRCPRSLRGSRSPR